MECSSGGMESWIYGMTQFLELWRVPMPMHAFKCGLAVCLVALEFSSLFLLFAARSVVYTLPWLGSPVTTSNTSRVVPCYLWENISEEGVNPLEVDGNNSYRYESNYVLFGDKKPRQSPFLR